MDAHTHSCRYTQPQGNVVGGTAPGTVDAGVAVDPDGNKIVEPAANPEMDKEHAEVLLQVRQGLCLGSGCGSPRVWVWECRVWGARAWSLCQRD